MKTRVISGKECVRAQVLNSDELTVLSKGVTLQFANEDRLHTTVKLIVVTCFI